MSELSAWDLDGTMRPGYLLEDAIKHGAETGIIDPSRFTNIHSPSGDELRYFVDSLTLQHRKVFNELIDRVSDEAKEQAFPWALETLGEQSAADTHRVIISTSPDFLVRAFARGLGNLIHKGYGSYFHTRSLTFSGHAVTRRKLQTARRYMRHNRLSTIAFAAGDSEADVPLLLSAAHSTVVNPAGQLAVMAEQYGWQVINTKEVF